MPQYKSVPWFIVIQQWKKHKIKLKVVGIYHKYIKGDWMG